MQDDSILKEVEKLAKKEKTRIIQNIISNKRRRSRINRLC